LFPCDGEVAGVLPAPPKVPLKSAPPPEPPAWPLLFGEPLKLLPAPPPVEVIELKTESDPWKPPVVPPAPIVTVILLGVND
jgi:hypothetical protein